MAERYYLIVDLGTGSSRVALTSSDGDILGFRQFSNIYYTDELYEDGKYFHPEEWKAAILQGTAELMDEFPDVRVSAVTSAGARQSFVLLDGSGEAFLGLPNIDNRGREFMDRIDGKEVIYRITGKWVTEDPGAAKLLGLRKRRLDAYAKVMNITSVSEWIGQIFTGNVFIEPSQGCETGLLDIRTCTWSKETAERYGIDPAILPELIPAGESAGAILPALRLRFHMADDAVFLVGGADTQAAVKNVDPAPGEIAIVSGTTSPCVTLTDEIFYDPEQRVWSDLYLGGKTCMVEMNPGVTGLNYQRVKSIYYPDVSYEWLEEAYATKTKFSCTASFTSLLFHEQRSLKRGGFFFPSPLSEEAERSDLGWAVLGDIACAIYEQLRRLIELTGNNPAEIRGCGGGLQSGTLGQMLADLSGKTLSLREGYQQATISGLVLLANEHFGITGGQQKRVVKVYEPRNEQLIHQYYPIWNENRLKANQEDSSC